MLKLKAEKPSTSRLISLTSKRQAKALEWKQTVGISSHLYVYCSVLLKGFCLECPRLKIQNDPL